LLTGIALLPELLGLRNSMSARSTNQTEAIHRAENGMYPLIGLDPRM